MLSFTFVDFALNTLTKRDIVKVISIHLNKLKFPNYPRIFCVKFGNDRAGGSEVVRLLNDK